MDFESEKFQIFQIFVLKCHFKIENSNLWSLNRELIFKKEFSNLSNFFFGINFGIFWHLLTFFEFWIFSLVSLVFFRRIFEFYPKIWQISKWILSELKGLGRTGGLLYRWCDTANLYTKKKLCRPEAGFKLTHTAERIDALTNWAVRSHHLKYFWQENSNSLKSTWNHSFYFGAKNQIIWQTLEIFK